MRSFPVAELGIQDVSIAIVFLDADFASSSPEQQHAMHARVLQCAARAGIRCPVVTMWRDSSGRKRFISEPAQRPFWESIRYDQLFAQRNRTVSFEP